MPLSRESDFVTSLTPRTLWWSVLRDATMEVFATVVNAKVEVPHAQNDFIVAPEPTDSAILAYLTGMIGIAGAMRAIFSIRCTENVATQIASQMLGISPERQPLKGAMRLEKSATSSRATSNTKSVWATTARYPFRQSSAVGTTRSIPSQLGNASSSPLFTTAKLYW